MDYKEYSDYIDQFCAALKQEISHLMSVGGKKYRIFNGICIYRNHPEYVNTFETDQELYLPDSSPVRLEFNGNRYTGEILSCEGFHYYFIIRGEYRITFFSMPRIPQMQEYREIR